MEPWYWRSLPLAERTASTVFLAFRNVAQALELDQKQLASSALATLLESPYPLPPIHPQLNRYSLCAIGPRILRGQPLVWTPALGEILPCLQNRLNSAQSTVLNQRLCHPQSEIPPDPTLPFTGGWLGWLGYDLAWEIEQLPYLKPDELTFPIAGWYEPECFAVLDHAKQILWLAASEREQLDCLEANLSTSPVSQAQRQFLLKIPTVLDTPLDLRFHTSQANFEATILQAQKHIQSGDIFQANLSVRFSTQTPADSWILYQALHQINPSPFASYWSTPWGAIISCSPERLVTLQETEAQTRPIAGTRPRTFNGSDDQQLATELLNNAKERAEHIMLVDLERNDLGRVCTWGSVQVDELLCIERYSHVMHLVSNVKGTLHPQHTAIDLIRAMFPGGTITGCPKVRCMEIIEELEPQRRNLFYGSCGYLDWRGHLDLNILIRTLLWQSQQPIEPLAQSSKLAKLHTVWGQVGAGIVADSNPNQEWQESLQKAQAQLIALKWVNA
jgi:para-aminobenzoate synthetase component I